MIYFNNDIKKINYQGYDITKVYACGGELVWSADVSYKFIANYSGGETYSKVCDGSSVLGIWDTQYNGYEASAMTSAIVGDCITDIQLAFANCYALEEVVLPSGLTTIGDNSFQFCHSLSSITIPSNVTTIGNDAFTGCSGLTSIDIPDSVAQIGDNAFGGTFGVSYPLTSVTIGSGVTSIGERAFRFHDNLTSITVNATTPPTLGKGAFDNTNDCPIYVPCQSVDAYKTAWSTYANRIACVPPAPGKIHFYRADLTGNTATTSCVTAFTDVSTSSYPRNYEFDLSADTVCGLQGVVSGVVKRGICSVILPENTKRVEDSAFYMQDIPSNPDSRDNPVIVLNEGLETIGIYAFCGYVDDADDFAGGAIIIPDTVTSIGYAAFNLDNASFQSFTTYGSKFRVYFKSQTPPTMFKIFGEAQSQMNGVIQIYVPTGTTSAYREALGSQYDTIPIEEYDGNITYMSDLWTYERLSTQGLV